MGAMLPKAVESTVVERQYSKGFRVGLCEMNGWRNNMEDSHVIISRPDWGYFGVFDGHGGDMCSAFVAEKLKEHIERHGCPKDDAALKQLVFDVDAKFLETGKASGSTATMCIVHKNAGSKCQIRVANAGDSRILLGRRNGQIVDGGGTDQGLTTDHKPSHPAERQRIYRYGGHVEEATGGVARVNGELAVSRGFGDAEYKKTGGPGPEERPVTCSPEFGVFNADEADFLLLVCDGVSEGDFPNPEVVKLVAERLRETDDPGAASEAVCFMALEKNSKDNITCMCVLLKGAEKERNDVVFTPGPLVCINNKGFMEAYEAMAKKAKVTLAKAAEMRYDKIVEELAKPDVSPARAEEMKAEADKLGTPEGAKGSAERARWWEERMRQAKEAKAEEGADQDPDAMDQAMLMRILLSRYGSGLPLQSQDSKRRIRVPSLVDLKQAVDNHPSLEFDERMKDLAGEEGVVIEEDTDGTSQVRFEKRSCVAWLPTNILMDVGKGPLVRESRSPPGVPGKGSEDMPAAGYSARRLLPGRAASGAEAQRPLLPRLGQRSVGAATLGRGGSPTTPTPTHTKPRIGANRSRPLP